MRFISITKIDIYEGVTGYNSPAVYKYKGRFHKEFKLKVYPKLRPVELKIRLVLKERYRIGKKQKS